MAVALELRRAPKTDDELHAVIRAMWGIHLPRVKVCPDHVSPFQAVADAYFAREPGYAVWYASRGSGKSLALAVLGLTKTLIDDVDTTILGGSMTQSQNVATHMSDLLHFKRAPTYALRGGSISKGVTATQITTNTGHRIRPIPASQTTVRGPHPPLSLLDEVDEMEYKIYEAAMGQAMEQVNSRGEVIGEYIVASSTWQNTDGCFTKVMNQARKKGLPIYTWCWRELLEPNGWMSQRFINQKKQAVTEEMWRTEYELNEPSGASRAFDLTKLEEYFIPYPKPVDYKENGEDDQTWVWEDPVPSGSYAVGADWAKEKDKTVIACIRYDINPRKLVYLRRVNRQPYPAMIKSFDDVIKVYNAVGLHDKTGLGNVVHDFSTSMGSGEVSGFNFSDRRRRAQMLLHYIADVEHGGYLLPRGDTSHVGQLLGEFHKGHRSTTTADVYGTHKAVEEEGKHHLPDDVAAMGLAHRAAGRIPTDLEAQGIPVNTEPREIDKQFHVKPHADDEWIVRSTPDVVIVDERYEAPIADFGFLDLSI